jgi:desulfoferrodoxin (superoxide reductase-like protein)
MGASFSSDESGSLGLEEKEQLGLKRRVSRKISGALENVPSVIMSTDRERNVRTVTISCAHPMSDPNYLKHIWARMSASPADTDQQSQAFKIVELKPGDEPVLRFELPSTVDIALLPRITAFSHSNLHGSWASPTYECKAIAAGYLVLQELDENQEDEPMVRTGRSVSHEARKGMTAEVVGDVDMDPCRSLSPPPVANRTVAA